MPFRAIDEKTNQAYPIEWFLKNGKVAGVCGYCGTLMTIKANHTSDKRAHFWHGSGDSNCPTITKNGSAYEGLEGGTLDKEAGLQMIQLVNNNMFQIYLACMKIINKSLFLVNLKSGVLKLMLKKYGTIKVLLLNMFPTSF